MNLPVLNGMQNINPLNLFGNPLSEIRIFTKDKYNSKYNGFFNNWDKAKEAVKGWDGQADIYFTINELNPDLAFRNNANMLGKMKEGEAANDSLITRRRWFYIDFDPERIKGISSTDEEKGAAWKLLNDVYKILEASGFSTPIICDSGNGYHLVYRVDLPNDKESGLLIKNVLKCLSIQYSTSQVKIDTAVFNASRITKFYGVMAVKGTNSPERPHRRSGILYVPEPVQVTPREVLEEFVKTYWIEPERAPAPAQGTHSGGQWNFDEWLADHRIAIKDKVPTGDGIRYYLEDGCPFNPEHTGKDAVLFQYLDGRIGFKCFHDHCQDKKWPDFREFYEPDAYTKPRITKPHAPLAPTKDSVVAKVDEIIQAEPDTLETLMPDTLLDMLFDMEDEVARQREIAKLRAAARKNNLVRDMDKILKARISKTRRADGSPDSAQQYDCIVLPEIPLQGLKVPGDWIVEESTGVWMVKDEKTVYACPHPVIITERLQNIDTRAEKLNIAFLRDHRWTFVPVKRSITASRTSIVSLADTGLQVNSEIAKNLVLYLNQLETVNRDVIPRKKSISRAGWVGTDTFFPYSGDYTFDGEEEFRDMYEALTEVGSASEWLTLIEQEREKSPCLRAMLAASFSAPLLWLLGLLCFCVHGWGISGTGKTVALYGAMSIWGNPLALIRSFNATELGLEKCAAFCHSIPLALDERETAKNDRYAAFDQLIYRLTEGHGRAKSNRNSGLQRIDRWQLPILTTGESPLIADNSKGGAQNRVIELYCDTPLLTDAPAAAEVFKTCYGGVGKQWIKELLGIARDPDKMDWLKNTYQLFKNYLQGSGQYNDKPLASVAAMMLADHLSSLYLFNLDNSQAESEAFQLGRTIISGLQTRREADEANRAWEFICGWVASNKNHFITFHDPCFGIIDEKGVFIISSVFTQAMTEAGFNPRSCAKAWADRELLIPQGDGKHLQAVRRIGGIVTRGYRLKIDVHDQPDTTITTGTTENFKNGNAVNPL